MKPSIFLSGHASTDRRYTYGEHLLFGTHFRYGGPGAIVSMTPELSPHIMAYLPDLAGTLITYNESTYLYSDSRLLYSGAPNTQQRSPHIDFDGIRPKMKMDV